MESFSVDFEVVVRDRNGNTVEVDDLDYSRGEIEVLLTDYICNEEDKEILALLSSRELNCQDDVLALLDEPAVTEESVLKFVTAQSAEYKLNLIKVLLSGD